MSEPPKIFDVEPEGEEVTELSLLEDFIEIQGNRIQSMEKVLNTLKSNPCTQVRHWLTMIDEALRETTK